MATSSLLEPDFESESEDDNFNPAPADVSDNDAIGESDTEDVVRPGGTSSEPPRRTIQGDGHGRDESLDPGVKQNGELSRRRSRDDGSGENADDSHDVNGRGENGTGIGDRDVDDEDDEEDEDDEDDEDDEEAVSVGWHHTQLREVYYTQG